jgi:hypothetical protein
MVPRRLLPGLALVLCSLGPAGALGRVSAESRYTKAQNYSAALRFLRVDKGFEVVERDADAAYLIFRYPTPERREQSATGTIEVIEVNDGVTIIVNLPQMPQYHERVLSDQLQRKLREEYGPPKARHPEPAKPEKNKPEKKRRDASDGEQPDS